MTASLRWTSADLFSFVEDGKLREIIDGELHISSQSHFCHQVLITNIAVELSLWDSPRERGFAVPAPGLIFSDNDDVAPDVIWVSRDRLASIEAGGKLYAAPEVVIEILSPGSRNVARDRESKMKLYSRREVQEYWIADWPRHRVEVYRREGATLVLAEALGPGDTLTSPLLPDFAVPIDRLFLGVPFGMADDE